MRKKTPLALFSYNRPQHVIHTLHALEKCSHLDELDLILFCDGAKGEMDKPAVVDNRRVIKEWAMRYSAQVVERSENWGLAKSISCGVTEICQAYGRVIVLEDDLIPSPDFIDYMLKGLDKYEEETQVYQISGYMFPIKLNQNEKTFLLPLSTTWGWATWQRAWEYFDWDMKGAIKVLSDPKLRKRFNLDGTYPYMDMLKSNYSKKIDSWGICWWWTVFKNNGLVLYPPCSLIWVGGWDGSGTNVGAPSHFAQDNRIIFSENRLKTDFSLPVVVSADAEAFEGVIKYLATKQRLGKGRKIKRMFYKIWRYLTRIIYQPG